MLIISFNPILYHLPCNQRRGGRERKAAHRESVQSILRDASEDALPVVNEDTSEEPLVDSTGVGDNPNSLELVQEEDTATVLAAIIAQANNKNIMPSTQSDDVDVSNNVCKSLIYTLYLCIYFKHHVFTSVVTHLYTQYSQLKIHSQGFGRSKEPY